MGIKGFKQVSALGLLVCWGLNAACTAAAASGAQPSVQSQSAAGAATSTTAPQTVTGPAGAQPAAVVVPPRGTPLTVELPSLPDPDFQNGLNEIGPLTPSQIKQLRRYRDDTERAQAAQPRFQPKPVYSDLPVSLRPKPGEAPQMARLYPNFQTNILFYDDYGNPLSVMDVTAPPAEQFTVTWSKDQEHSTNSIRVSPVTMYANGSISVQLQGVPAPVSLLLASGQREVDIDATVRVRGIGRPQVVAGVGVPIPRDVDPEMLALLTGVPPISAKSLRSSNSSVQAWRIGQSFYVKTSFTLLSPAATAIQRGSDGSAVYKIQPTPVLIALTGGETVNITLSGY